MPIRLKKAHENLDTTVLNLLGIAAKATDAQILAALFALYSEMQTQPQL